MDFVNKIREQDQILFRLFAPISSALVACFGIVYLFYFGSIKIFIACIFCSIAIILTKIIFKISNSFRFSVWYFLFASILIVVYTSIYTGNRSSPVLFWVTVLPISGAFLIREKMFSAKVGILSLSCYIFLYLYEMLYGIEKNILHDSLIVKATFFAVIGILIYNIVFSYIFESTVSKTTTDLLKSQELLFQAKKNETLGTFAAGLAHELLNNLAYIKNCIPLIEKKLILITDEEKKNKAHEVLSRIRIGVTQSIEICNGFSIYSGNGKFTFNRFNIKEIISSVVSMLKHLADKKHILIDISIDTDLTIYGNASGFHQVFMNLIKNAIEASKDGGFIKTTCTLSEDQYCLEVIDNGDGMSKDSQEKVFDPFFTTKDIGEGMGIGLSTAKGIIEAHNGTLSIKKSELGKGTTFLIKIPITSNKG